MPDMSLRDIQATLDALGRAYDALLDAPYHAQKHIDLPALYDALEAYTATMQDLLRTAELARLGKTPHNEREGTVQPRNPQT